MSPVGHSNTWFSAGRPWCEFYVWSFERARTFPGGCWAGRGTFCEAQPLLLVWQPQRDLRWQPRWNRILLHRRPWRLPKLCRGDHRGEHFWEQSNLKKTIWKYFYFRTCTTFCSSSSSCFLNLLTISSLPWERVTVESEIPPKISI